MASTESSSSFANLSPSSSWTNQSSSPFGPEKKPSTVTISEAMIRLKSPPCRRCTDLLDLRPPTHPKLIGGKLAAVPVLTETRHGSAGKAASHVGGTSQRPKRTMRRQGLAASVDTGRRDGRARLRRYP